VSRDALTPARWAQVLEVFHEALAREGPERTQFLTATSAGDPDLAREVRSLLDAHERGGPVGEPAAGADPVLPQWVGPYRLIREIGQGGMGTVYLATREGEGFTQTVALKLLRADSADARTAARLAAERRILARLEHPGIARFVDGGTTGTGQPYVAMEYVEGTPLLEYCNRRRLGVRERLELALQVCDAVQYAHGQLVVHRDLKPANIQVTVDGRPKLLDFGVAKLLDDSAPDAQLTHTGLWATPSYASPEQMQQQPVSVLTDVYALGVVLYELLTGRLPYRVDAGSIADMARVVCEVIPERPSVVVARGQDEPPIAGFTSEMETTGRRSRSRALARRLSGDLDTIVLKALAKEPGRRYGSVEQLAEDVRRHLDGRPVLARRDSIGYRTSKFVRRHRLAVGAVALLAVSLVAGVAATAWQASVAARERDRAQDALRRSEEVTAFLIDLFGAANTAESETDTLAARAILRRGLDRVEQLDELPLVQASMLDALGLALIQLGQFEGSRELLGRSLALRERELSADDPDVALSLRYMARALRYLGEYHRADTLLRQALAIDEAAFGPDDPRVAETLAELAFLMPYLARIDETVQLYRQVLDIRRRAFGPDHPSVTAAMITVGLALRRKGDWSGAEAMLSDAVAVRRRTLGPEHPQVAQALIYLGQLLSATEARRDEGERLLREATAILERLYGPNDLRLNHGLSALADVLTARGAYQEAERLRRRLLAMHLEVLGPDHPSTILTREYLAGVLADEGRYAEAEAIRRTTLAQLQRAMGPRHTVTAGSMVELARVIAAQGRRAEAERLMREALAIREAVLEPRHNHISLTRVELARLRMAAGDYVEAESLLTRAVATMTATSEPMHPDLRMAEGVLAELYAATGRAAEAARYRTLAAGSAPR